MRIVVLLVFLSILMYRIIHSQQKAPQRTELLRYRRDGDVIIGAMFPLHMYYIFKEYVDDPCGVFDIYAYNCVLAMKLAIDNIMGEPLVLPNITVGFEMYDSCGNPHKCLESTFWFLSGRSKEFVNYKCDHFSYAAAMIAEWLPGNSVAIAQILGLHRFPQVSYGTEEPFLSDHIQFPSFLRSIPSKLAVLDGVMQLLVYYKWTWVSVLVPLDFSTQESVLELKKRLIDAGICIELFQTMPVYHDGYEKLAKMIKTLSSKVIITANSAGLGNFYDNVVRENISGITWIGLDWWPEAMSYTSPKYHKVLQGTLWFIPAVTPLVRFKNLQYSINPSNDPNDVFGRLFWESFFGCEWPKYNTSYILPDKDTTVCTGAEDLRSVKENSVFFNDIVFLLVYTTFNAVSAVVYAIHELQKCIAGKGPFSNGSCAHFPDFQPWQLFHYLHNVHATTYINDEIFFNDEGYIPSYYHIANWQVSTNGMIKYLYVGVYNPQKTKNSSLLVNRPIIWNGDHKQPPRSVCSEFCLPGFIKAIQRGKPACCYDCIPCGEGAISNYSDSTDCLACPSEEWPNERRDKCVPRSIDFLSYSDVLGSVLAAVAVTSSFLPAAILSVFVKFSNTPLVRANNRSISYVLLVALLLCSLCSLLFIGHPDKMTCKLRQVVFGITFALSVSCVLAKTIMVVVAFNATKPNSHFRHWVGPHLSYSVIFLSTLVQVIICMIWIIFASPFPEWNFISQPGTIIIECNEGSTVTFWCMLGYMGLLAGTCFTVAFLSRNLPDSFNEAKFITFSMVVFVSVWLAFIPAYLSTKGKYMVAVEIFAILASSLGLLVCIFFPKCYIILMRPDTNTKEYLRRKGNKE